MASRRSSVRCRHGGSDGYPAGPLEILLRSYRRIELPGLVIRRGPMDSNDVSMLDGIRTIAVTRTLCDLGMVDSPARLGVAFDWAWRLEAAVEAVIGALPGLCRQYPVRRTDGSFVARVDVAIRDLTIAIEARSRRSA
jgi:hypothetical protein